MNNKKGQMKLTPRAMELLFELRRYESARNMQSIAGDLDQFGSKLLRLYRTTESLRSRGIISELLSEAGYPWFKKFAHNSITSRGLIVQAKTCNESSISSSMFSSMSDDEFLDMTA